MFQLTPDGVGQHAECGSTDSSPAQSRLYEKTALEWQTASYDDKLATCRLLLFALWQQEALKPHVQNKIHSVDDLEPFALELVARINAATKPDPDPEMNQRVFGQFKVHQIAAAGIITMGWGE